MVYWEKLQSHTLLTDWSTEVLLWWYHKSTWAVIEAIKSVFMAAKFSLDREMFTMRKLNETWNSSLQSPQMIIKEDKTSAGLGKSLTTLVDRSSCHYFNSPKIRLQWCWFNFLLRIRVVSSLYLAVFYFSYSLTNSQQKLTPSTDTVWVFICHTTCLKTILCSFAW